MHCKSYSHFFSKKFQHICVSLDVNFNESLTNDVVSFEQLGPGYFSVLTGSLTILPFFFNTHLCCDDTINCSNKPTNLTKTCASYFYIIIHLFACFLFFFFFFFFFFCFVFYCRQTSIHVNDCVPFVAKCFFYWAL